jgi:hypothetical protein
VLNPNAWMIDAFSLQTRAGADVNLWSPMVAHVVLQLLPPLLLAARHIERSVPRPATCTV